MHPLAVKEFSVISEGKHERPYNGGIELESQHFQELVSFIEENSHIVDGENAFLIFRKGQRRHIRVKNFVGAIETKRGFVLEILPKVYSCGIEADDHQSKSLFLRMLAAVYGNTKSINLGYAHLELRDNFPLLDLFVYIFVEYIDQIIASGLKARYSAEISNLRYIRGRILHADNFRKNLIDRSKITCEHDELSIDTPENRILKSTINHLLSKSKSRSLKQSLLRQSQHFSMASNIVNGGPLSRNLRLVKRPGYLRHDYVAAIDLAEKILSGAGFTTFSGSTINQANLFPSEKLFESYIAFLLKKYAPGMAITSQDKKYYLLAQKSDENDSSFTRRRLRLKPDIVSRSSPVILDTKWKILESSGALRGVSEADVYQMHAYGQKYRDEYASDLGPLRLGLLYPSNPKFREKLLQLRFNSELLLDIVPFDLMANPAEEVGKLINYFSGSCSGPDS
jgi:5-methylcytosine-specific restriction enzyme subunit McrC